MERFEKARTRFELSQAGARRARVASYGISRAWDHHLGCQGYTVSKRSVRSAGAALVKDLKDGTADETLVSAPGNSANGVLQGKLRPDDLAATITRAAYDLDGGGGIKPGSRSGTDDYSYNIRRTGRYSCLNARHSHHGDRPHAPDFLYKDPFPDEDVSGKWSRGLA